MTRKPTIGLCTEGHIQLSQEQSVIELVINTDKIFPKKPCVPFTIELDPFTHKIRFPESIKIVGPLIPKDFGLEAYEMVQKRINDYINQIKPIIKGIKPIINEDVIRPIIQNHIKPVIQKEVKSLLEDELKRITHNVVQRVIKEKFEDLIQKEIKRITQNIIRNILNEKLSPF